jgi:hypothetical protein
MSSVNHNASLGFTQQWMGKILADPSFADITAFVNNPFVSSVGTTSTTQSAIEAAAAQTAAYDLAKVALDGMISKYYPAGRILLSLDDGTTIYDSSRNSSTTSANATNTALNFKNKGINENHNSRPEIMLATLSSSGVGWTSRFSTSTSFPLFYLAQRLGQSVNSSIAILRVSVLAKI